MDGHKDIDIKALNSAGVILYNARGYWLGYERTNGKRFWTDYGGKRMGKETAWETAVRECKEEAGVDVGRCTLARPPDFHSQFTDWPEHELHPRLRYDKGGMIWRTRVELGFETTV